MDHIIYQSSDLAGGKRTAFLDEARNGRARLRDKDGTSLVMLPERDLAVLEDFARWSRIAHHLESLLKQERDIQIAELGELGWLRVFDRDDLRLFAEELEVALIASLSDNHTELVDEVVRDWNLTARQLEDPLRRSILLGKHSPADFEEVAEPSQG